MIPCSSQNGMKACRRLYSFHRLRQVSTKSSVRDYYEVLGLQRDATQRQIKSAYYELSKKYHPDVAGRSAGAEAKFIEITEAYECLKDPEKRRIYDSEGVGGGQYNEDHFKTRDFWEYSGKRPENAFRSRRFTRQEYERVWEEFNRRRAERESYDERIRREREKLFEEFLRERAAKWQNFRSGYSNESPGSFRYTWKWTSQNPTANRNLVLFTRILVIYMACFTVVTIFQVILAPFFRFDTSRNSNKHHDVQVEQPEDSNESPRFHYMNHPPTLNNDEWSDVIGNPYPSSEMVGLGSAHDNSTANPTNHSV